MSSTWQLFANNVEPDLDCWHAWTTADILELRSDGFQHAQFDVCEIENDRILGKAKRLQ
jgi:hypothetical protein